MSSHYLLPNQLIRKLWVGPPFGLLHQGPDKRSDGPVLPIFNVLNNAGIFLEYLIHKAPQLSFETVKLVSMAKLYVAEIAQKVADECLQFHGGMGYCEETFIARAWRDSRLLSIGGGASEVMRYAIAKILGL